MKKRPDEKFNILNRIGNYGVRLEMLESMYFKAIHKKATIVLWMHYPNKEQRIVAIKEEHEARTEKDIIRYFTLLCDKLRKRYRPLEDKRKVCIANFKGDKIDFLSSP
jgi:hypothetical protein